MKAHVLVAVVGLGLLLALSAARSPSVTAQTPPNSTVWLWGDYPDGLWSSCANTSTAAKLPASVSALDGAVAMAAGSYHIVALKDDGTVWSGQYNPDGSANPAPVSNLAGMTAVASGSAARHSLAIKDDGTLWAWGDNFSGQLGNGGTTSSPSGVQVSGLTGAVAAAAGGSHSVAVRADGTLWHWGYGRYPTPVQVGGIGGVVAVATGEGHAVALKADGSVWVWDQYSPLQQVANLSRVVAISAGRLDSLAVTADGAVWYWGRTANDVPVQVGGISGAVAVAAGSSHRVAVKGDGTVWAWGNNDYGQLGDGTCTSSATPVQSRGLQGAVSIAAGWIDSLALTDAAPTEVTIAPASLDFGSHLLGSTSAAHTVTLTNSGGATLNLGGITTIGDFAQTNNCGGGLPAGASCMIRVTFTPDADGRRSGAISISGNVPGGVRRVALSGSGISPAVTLAPQSLSFAGQAVGTTSTAKVVTLTNSGSAPLTLGGIAPSGDFSQTSDCPGELAPSASCAITVRFAPARVGTQTGALTITNNAASSPETVPLNGTGLTATTMTVAATAGRYGDVTTLTATLTTGGTPIGGRSITFSRTGSPVGSAMTDANGVATLANVSLAGLDAGPYPNAIGASFAGDSTTYAPSNGAATLTVTPAPLTVTADSQRRSYGQPNPPLTGRLSGLMNRDSITTSYTTPADATSNVGDYPIVAALIDPDGRLDNYTVSLTPGVLTVVAAAQAIIFAPLPGRSLGDAPFPAVAAATSGLPVGFSATGGCTVVGNVVTLLGPGTCAITAEQPGDGNYTPAVPVTRAFQVASAYIFHLTVSGPGDAISTARGTFLPAGSSTTLTAMPTQGAVFVGWTIDGAAVGWANPLTIVMDRDHTVQAVFTARPRFADVSTGDPAYEAISQLAARGIVRGYGNGGFGPADTTLRAQMAALIARAMGWADEDHGSAFPDQGAVDAALWRNVNTLAHYKVARGFQDGTYKPTASIAHAQVISFITRAMVAKGYWQHQPDSDASLYPNITMASGHRQDLITYYRYAGAIPDTDPRTNWTNWDKASTRAWFAQTLWQALSSYFSLDRTL